MRSLLLIFFSFLPFLFFYLNTHIHLARRPVSGYLFILFPLLLRGSGAFSVHPFHGD